MKKIDIKKIQGYFPLTLQMAEKFNRAKTAKTFKLPAKAYQSDNVNSQQFYKPISKIIRFS